MYRIISCKLWCQAEMHFIAYTFCFYINDLGLDIKNLNVGITAGNLNLSLLLYADDIVLLAGTAGDLQLQLNVLNQWCYKCQMTITKLKVKLSNSGTKRRSKQYQILNVVI